jgi:hypothetical protein
MSGLWGRDATIPPQALGESRILRRVCLFAVQASIGLAPPFPFFGLEAIPIRVFVLCPMRPLRETGVHFAIGEARLHGFRLEESAGSIPAVAGRAHQPVLSLPAAILRLASAASELRRAEKTAQARENPGT